MVPVILGDRVRIPGGIEDLEAFRRWAKSDEFPEHGRFAFLGDDLWVDLEMEAMYSHNGVKTEFTRTLGGLVRLLQTGRYLSDGMRFHNTPADLSTATGEKRSSSGPSLATAPSAAESVGSGGEERARET